MLNKIVLMGRLTKDPERRATMTGIPASTFTIAVERNYKGQNGERETDFFDVVTWRNTAEFVQKFFTKGRMIVVEGRLENRSWTADDGGKRTKAQIVAESVYFGDSAKESGQAQAQQEQPQQATAVEDGGYSMIDDPDLPF